jgi:hypothetical protein
LWQKWFEAHPDDEPESDANYDAPKKGPTTMETISHSFLKGTKKLGKAVVGEGNLDDTSESSDEEEKKERKRKGTTNAKREKEEERHRKDEDEDVVVEVKVKQREPEEERRGPAAEPWKHDAVPGQDEFRRAEAAKLEENENRKRREEERRRGEEKRRKDAVEEEQRKNSRGQEKKRQEEEEELNKERDRRRKKQEKDEEMERKQHEQAAAEEGERERKQVEVRKYDELASEREQRLEREAMPKARAPDERQGRRKGRKKVLILVCLFCRKEKEAHQRTVETRMTRGQELDLSMMGLTRLPTEWLAAMKSVRFVDLSFNVFDEFPEEALLQHASHCQFLVMGGCQLTSLPQSIGQFKELKVIFHSFFLSSCFFILIQIFYICSFVSFLLSFFFRKHNFFFFSFTQRS